MFDFILYIHFLSIYTNEIHIVNLIDNDDKSIYEIEMECNRMGWDVRRQRQ